VFLFVFEVFWVRGFRKIAAVDVGVGGIVLGNIFGLVLICVSFFEKF